MIICQNSEITDIDHFVVDNKMVEIGSGAKREQKQTYFAVQTRKQEISEKEYSMLTEDEKRFYQRDLTRKGLRYREDILDNMGSDELIS